MPGSPAFARRLPAGVTAAAAVVFLIALLAGFVTAHLAAGHGERSPGVVAGLIAAAAVVGAGATLRWPVVGTIAAAAAIGTYLGAGYPNGPVFGAGLATMFVLGLRSSRRLAVGALVAIEAGLVIGWLVRGSDGALVALYPGWAAAAGAIGATLHGRRESRAEEGRRRAAEERLRIARDLHDGVAHAMATINVQAAAAAHVLDRRPEAAKDALVAIAQASGTVLDELNALLRVLRDADEPAERAPAPGLADIAALLEPVGVDGRSARLRSAGDLDAVPSTVATAAYRIVQESITNLLKHSKARAVTVEVTVADGRLRLAVFDDGGPLAAPAAGHGLRGMHERATATGGTLTAGPEPAGFAVRAEWSLR